MLRRWALGVLLGSGVAAAAYWRRALTLDGAIAATAVGTVVYARGGIPAVRALLAFFVTSSALSRLGEARKRSLPAAQAKGAIDGPVRGGLPLRAVGQPICPT